MSEIRDQILTYLSKPENAHASYREIGEALGLPHGNIFYHVTQLASEGKLERTEDIKGSWKVKK